MTARAAFLNRQQTQPAVRALLGDGVVAALTVHGVRRGQLAAGLADVQQRGICSGRRAALALWTVTTIQVGHPRVPVRRSWREGIAARLRDLRRMVIRSSGGR